MKQTLEISNAITNIRVLATIVIVLYHCTCPYWAWQWGGYLGDYQVDTITNSIFLRYLADTMLPTFFMLSGILFYGRPQSYSNRMQAVWKKFDRLCIPLAIITTVCVWLKMGGLHDMADGHLWFIEVLFIYFCMSIALSKIPAKYHILAAAVMHVVYILSGKIEMDLPWETGHILKYYIFFTGGYYIARYAKALRTDKLLKVGITAILLLSAIFSVQTLYMIFFNLALVSWISNSEIKSKLWKNLNANSFSIYLLHHPIITGLFYTPFFQQLYAHEATLSILLMFVVAFLITWALAEGLHRAGFKYF